MYELLKKHYNTIWKSLPQDLEITIKKMDAFFRKSGGYSHHYFRQAPNILSANQRALDMLIIVSFKSNSSKEGPLMFIAIITAIIGDSTFTRNLRKGKVDTFMFMVFVHLLYNSVVHTLYINKCKE